MNTAKRLAMATGLLTLTAVALGFQADARGWNADPNLSDTSKGTGTLQTNRGSERLTEAYCQLGNNNRASIWLNTGRDKWSVQARYSMNGREEARLMFDGAGFSGSGSVTFRNGHLLSLNLNGRNTGGKFSANFRSTENNNGGNGGSGGWNPGNGGNNGNWGGWNGHEGWGNGNWNDNSVVQQWSGTRSGRGPVKLEGRFNQNWSKATVLVQKDRDTLITINGGGRNMTLRGKTRKEGNMLYVDIRDAFGQRQANGTAKIYLNKGYGEFYKITMSGTAGGRRFTGTFDDWN